MGLFTGIGNLFRGRKASWSDTDDRWYDPSLGALGGLTRVPTLRALRLSTMYACVRLWSYPMASVSCVLYERTGPNGERERAEGNPLFSLLHDEPSSYQTAFEFIQEVVARLATDGQAFAEKVPGPRNAVAELWPIANESCHLDWLDRRSGRRRVLDVSSIHDGRARVLLDDQFWHPRLGSLDGGLNGASPIALASDTLAGSLAAQTAATRNFQSGLRPAFQIVTDSYLSDEDAEAISARVTSTHGGPNRMWRPLILGKGAEAKPVSITPKDAQMIEYMQASIADMARFYGIPLHLLQSESKDTSWGSGIEHLKLAYHAFTLAPLAKLLQDSLDKALITDRRRFFFEFDMNSLLRGDMKTQYEAFQIGLSSNNPFLKRNEVRRWLNLPPDNGPDGDKFMPAVNNVGPGGNETGKQNGVADQVAALEELLTHYRAMVSDQGRAA